ncbi:MAG: hypothetical protein R2770_00140 [Acidimicrobiales bacterium]
MARPDRSFLKRLASRSAGGTVDLRTAVGGVELVAPVMTASGTAGHGAELGAFQDLSALGAVVVKSLSAEPWAGNPAPRVHETASGMINSVGLQNPGSRPGAETNCPNCWMLAPRWLLRSGVAPSTNTDAQPRYWPG